MTRPTPVPVATALGEVLEGLKARSAVALPLTDAGGLVLARDVVAPGALPPEDCSAMDGYALHAVQTLAASATDPVAFPIDGASLAGRPDGRPLPAGAARAVATGARIPPGATAVVRVEDARRTGDLLEVRAPVTDGRDIRRAGEDARPGDVLLASGARLNSAALAGLSGAGVSDVAVAPHPRVAILPTGDEVVRGDTLDAVTPGLLRLLELDGASVRPLAPVPDDPQAIMAAVREAGANADVVITVGGVSVGPRDHAADLVGALAIGAVRPLALRPGRPFAWGRTGEGCTVLCLPGSPIAALAVALVIGRPVVARLAGRPAPEAVPVQVGTPVLGDPHRRTLVPASLDVVGRARPVEGHGAGDLARLAATVLLLDLPAGTDRVDGGATVQAWFLP